MDAPAISNPVDLDAWNRAMSGTQARRWLTGKVETQGLLGERAQVAEVRGDWAKVQLTTQTTPRDPVGYPGWVPVIQLANDQDFAQTSTVGQRVVVVAPLTDLRFGSQVDAAKAQVSMNTSLPLLREDGDQWEVKLPRGRTGWLTKNAVRVGAVGATPPAATGAQVVATARQFNGLRYLWGGISGFGLDCSGLTFTAFRAHGVNIPRDSGPQSTSGTVVAKADLAPGDLLFFAKPGGTGKVHHVGMYIGQGQMLHSPNAAESVTVVNWEQWDSNRSFAGARRFVQPG